MIREKLVPVAWLLAASLLLGAAMYFASPVHASPADDYAATAWPAVCSTLDTYPTEAGLLGVAQGILDDRPAFSVDDAAHVIVSAVWEHCPRHKALILDYTYGDRSVAA